jgi:hypothetical protein
MINLHRSNFHFSAGAKVTARTATFRAFGKHILGLKLLLTIGTPETSRNRINYQLGPFCESARCERVKGKAKSFRHDTAESSDPQADRVHSACASLLCAVQYYCQCAFHNG